MGNARDGDDAVESFAVRDQRRIIEEEQIRLNLHVDQWFRASAAFERAKDFLEESERRLSEARNNHISAQNLLRVLIESAKKEDEVLQKSEETPSKESEGEEVEADPGGAVEAGEGGGSGSGSGGGGAQSSDG